MGPCLVRQVSKLNYIPRYLMYVEVYVYRNMVYWYCRGCPVMKQRLTLAFIGLNNFEDSSRREARVQPAERLISEVRQGLAGSVLTAPRKA